MAREYLETGIDLGAHCLCNAKDHAACQSAPEVAKAPDNHGFKAENQASAADRRVKACPDTKKDACNRRHTQCQCHGQSEHMATVKAHQLGNVLIVRHGPEGAPCWS